MLKKNKWTMIITSIVILLPMIFGVLVWNKLPESMIIHWGGDGAADGTGSRALAVFLIPAILLVLQWVCFLTTTLIDKEREQNPKVMRIVLWIMPIMSIAANATVYMTAFGYTIKLTSLLFLPLGIMFVVIGNYLPKCKQSYTVGIKLPWTLGSEENWLATHRFGGKVWLVGGVVFMLCSFLPVSFVPLVLVPMILVLAFVPMIYSYVFYRKQLASGGVTKASAKPMMSKSAKWISAIMLVAIFTLVGWLMFTGEIVIEYGEESFEVVASFMDDITVKYEDIDNIEYREKDDVGMRIYGFQSARLLVGSFQNDEFGAYTRYSYTGGVPCVILTVDDKILVVSGKDEAATKEIYQTLLTRK